MFISQTISIVDTAMYKNIAFGKLPGNVNPGIYIKVNRKGVLINSTRNIFNDRLFSVLSIVYTILHHLNQKLNTNAKNHPFY